MESLVLIPGALMAMCIIGCLVLFFKVKNEVLTSNSMIHALGLELLTGAHLTEKGRFYRVWYWRLFLLTFLFAAVAVLFMYLFVPEFQQEFSRVTKSV